ncbi:MAG: DUF885 domain-containing protein [Planctomycetia bacterium]|nr:DUF885 domain-containing protein [Planctomycetia bacterium]
MSGHRRHLRVGGRLPAPDGNPAVPRRHAPGRGVERPRPFWNDRRTATRGVTPAPREDRPRRRDGPPPGSRLPAPTISSSTPRPRTRTRMLISRGTNAEGRAHHCEQMTADEGFGDPKVRLAQPQEALPRVCRHVDGTTLHTGGWAVERGAVLFRGKGSQEPANDYGESRRGAYELTYLYDNLGELPIRELRDESLRRQPGVTPWGPTTPSSRRGACRSRWSPTSSSAEPPVPHPGVGTSDDPSPEAGGPRVGLQRVDDGRRPKDSTPGSGHGRASESGATGSACPRVVHNGKARRGLPAGLCLIPVAVVGASGSLRQPSPKPRWSSSCR